MDKMLFTAEEAAAVLGVGRTRVYDLIGRGQIESVVIGRSRRIPVDALAQYVERIRTENRPDAA